MMTRQNVLTVVVAAMLLGIAGGAQATLFDFEDPPYTAGLLTGNGWTIVVGTTTYPSYSQVTVATAHPYGGNQYLDLAQSGSYLTAAHAVDTYNSGVVIIEYANYYDGPGASSGKLMATNAAAGDTLLGVGVDTSGGANWLVAHGAGATQRIYGQPLPASLQWFLMRVEVNLDSDTADVMWKQNAGDSWSTITTGYATNNFDLDGIRLEGRKAAVGFDSVSVVPEPLSMVLLGLGGSFLVARRRRQR